MNIDELFDELQDNILGELNGEIILEGDYIVWSYNLDRDGVFDDVSEDDEDGVEFDFTSITSPEEYLLRGYNEDLKLIEDHIDIIDETDNWSYTDPEIGENVISFKIF